MLALAFLILTSAVTCPGSGKPGPNSSTGPKGPSGPKDSSGPACVTNPYIEVRKAFSPPIEFHTHAKMDSQFESCKSEWRVYGSCCKDKELKAHVEADEKNTEESAKKLVDLYNNFYNISDIILEKYMKLSVLEPGNWATSRSIKVRAARAFLSDLENVNNLDLYYDGDFATDSNNCWSTISKLRSSSVCFLCSGRGASFFNNNKGVSRFQYCNQALTSCYKVLKTTGRLINLIHWMIDVDQERDAGIYPTFADGTALASASPAKVGPRRLGALQLTNNARLLKKGKGGNNPVPLNATQTQVTAALKAIKFYEAFILDNFTVHLQQAFDNPSQNLIELNLAICDKFLNLAHRPFIDHFTDAISSHLLQNSAVNVHVDPETEALIQDNVDFILKKLPHLQQDLSNKLQQWRKNSAKQFQKLANAEFGQGNSNKNNNGNQNSNKNDQSNNKNNNDKNNNKRVLQEISWTPESLDLAPMTTTDWAGLSSDLGYIKETNNDPFHIIESPTQPSMNLSLELFS